MSTRIMIVDDSQEIRDLLTDSLGRRGYDVSAFGSAETALASWEAFKPDLAVLGVILPQMDGISLLQKIRSFASRLPVILCSGHHHFQQDFRSWSADAYIIKGMGFVDTLNDKIQELLVPV